MDDFLKRRQEARQRAAAFWQSWQWEQPWQAGGGWGGGRGLFLIEKKAI